MPATAVFLNEIHAQAASLRSDAVLDLVIEKTAYTDWLGGQGNRRGHLEHVQALRELLASSEAPDLATWLADLHLGDLEASPTDTAAVPLLTSMAARVVRHEALCCND